MLTFRLAEAAEAGPIADLINAAYRGESSRAGWTTEADLLVGLRTDEAEIRALIDAGESLILLCERDGETIGSVHLQKNAEGAYLGMFVVKPVLQGTGIGKQFMAAAEQTAKKEWGAAKITMTVISRREELIAFYERRGYRRTGRFTPFPGQAKSTPQVPDLMFEDLEKQL